ncbi:MFS transporter [Clostridium sp. 19966]|uniref:MFS transporter n=1 Tax=Clostridium sp. 19966 TaxID=2768166 RepID=UPI0028DEE25F|nr:MFS transporter [Clostridium sp. 19966]MDT8717638.1 MFS transporter [Clostridium sp. 19966]
MMSKDERDKFIQKNVKYNFILNSVDGAAFSLGLVFISFNTIFPVFLKKLGANNFLISLIPFITIAGSSFPQLFAAHYVKNLSVKKPFTAFIGLLQRIPWLILGTVTVIWGSKAPNIVLFSALFMLVFYMVAGGLSGPVWFDLISKITPISLRGRLMSARAIIGQLFGIIGSFFTAYIIGNIAYPYNYAALFFICFAILMISWAAFVFLKEPEDEVNENTEDFWLFVKGIPSILKGNKDFRSFVISRAFFELGIAVTAFYSVYSIKHFSLPDSYAGIFTTVTSIAYVAGNLVLGYLGDKKGHKLNLVIGMISCALGAIIAMLAGNVAIFYIIFVLASIAQGARDVSVSNITVEFCSSSERAAYIAISSIIMIPISLIVLPMGSIADIFGYNYLFLITMLSSIAAFAILYFKVRDPRHKHISKAK